MASEAAVEAAALALMDELFDGRASLPKDHPAHLPIYEVCFKRARVALEAAERVEQPPPQLQGLLSEESYAYAQRVGRSNRGLG